MIRRGLLAVARRAARFYPLVSGCGTIANSRAGRWLVGSDSTVVQSRTRWGSTIFVRPTDYVGRAIHLFGDLDPKVSRVVRQVVKPGDTVLDIGANIGIVTTLAAECVGASGHVHAFEPQPRLVELLRQTVAHSPQVQVHPIALGAEDATLDLHVPTDNAGAASLVRGDGDVVPVPVKHAGRYFESLGLGHVKLLKIDVEGFEAQVLTACSGLFERQAVDYVLFEHNHASRPVTQEPHFEMMVKHGYRMFGVPKSLVVPRFLRFPQETGDTPCNDFVALRSTVPELSSWSI